MAETTLYAVAEEIVIAIAASYVVQALTPAQKAEGPTFSSTMLQTSTEGVVQPLLHGVNRVAGNLIDGRDTFEDVAQTSNQGGKGGGGVDVTEHTYYATVAVRLCRVPDGKRVAGIRRLWADTDLLYDVSAKSGPNAAPLPLGRLLPSSFTSLEQYRAAANTGGLTLLNVTFYDGTQTEPDPTLEALHGVGNVPAYTGQCYLVFQRFDCTKYGRFPNITAEVVMDGGLSDVVELHALPGEPASGSVVQVAESDALRTVSFASGAGVYTRDSTGNTTSFNITSGTVGSVLAAAADDLFVGWRAPSHSASIARTSVAGAVRWTLTLPGSDESIIAGALAGDGALHVFTAQATWMTGQAPVTYYRLRRISAAGALTGTLELAQLAYGGSVSPVAPLRYDTATDTLVLGWVGGVYLINASTLAATFVPVANTAGYYLRDIAASGTAALLWSNGNTVRLDTVSLATHAVKTFKTWNSADAGALALGGSGALYALTWDITANTAKLHTIDVSAGADSERAVASITRAQVLRSRMAFESATGRLRAAEFDVQVDRLGAASSPVANVISDILAEAGIAAEDVDMQLTGTPALLGFQRTSLATARSTLEPLASAYSLDIVDVGHRIKVRSRGAAPVVTIHEDELLGLENNATAVLEVQLAQDGDLPAKLNVGFIDRGQDYANGSQPAQRRMAYGDTVQQLDLPIVFDGNAQPRHIADTVLAETRMAARGYKFVAPLDYFELEPGDAVTLALNDGTTRSVLLSSVEFSFDALALLCSGANYDPSLYGTLPAQVEADRTAATPAGASRLTLLELPALADTDATVPVLYAAGSPYVENGWKSSALFSSADGGTTLSYVQSLPLGVVGQCVDALPAGRQACYLDRETTLRVRLFSGELAGTTMTQLLAGANRAAVVRADGVVEVLQFLGAQLQSDGSYLLSGLLNGRAGTEHAMSGHAAGDAFVLLTSDRMARVVLDTAALGTSRVFAAVASGTVPANAIKATRDLTGVNLKPLAPVRVRGVRDSAGNLTISWTRRSRLRGAWRLGNWAPLGEASESYELEILGPTGAVVRTLASATPTLMYTAAQQVADFGAVQASVATRVYQLSQTVGRGYPAGATI